MGSGVCNITLKCNFPSVSNTRGTLFYPPYVTNQDGGFAIELYTEFMSMVEGTDLCA